MANGLDLELARDFGTALLLGALIGIEREKHNMRQGFGIAGVRSFVMLALIGAAAGFMSTTLALPWVLPAAIVAAAAAIVAGYVAGTKKRPESIGITTELASIFVCLLGAMVTSGYRDLGIGLGVVAAALLAYKVPLHDMVGRIGWDDVLVGMRLLLATFIVLPLLPDRTVDPWHAINPYKLWLLVLLISGLSLVGYVASRWLGPRRGLVLTAVTGGLVSSTAVTLAFARQSADDGAPRRRLAAGALLAWAIMSVRVVVAASIVNPALFAPLWPPCAVMALFAGAAAWIFLLRDTDGGAVTTEVPLKNPFSLVSASKFGLLFAAVQLLLALARLHLPESGTYTVAVLAGATDVDAITLSMAERSRAQAESVAVAVAATMLASFSNTAAKVAMAAFMGRKLTGYVLPVGAAMIAAGAAVLWFV